jgi:hypothetical protein
MEINEENKIQEAEVFPEKKADEVREEEIDGTFSEANNLTQEQIAKKAKSELRSRLILTFVLGILIGVALKTEALKRITIGYDDYLMKIKAQSYDINAIQAKLQSQAQESAEAQKKQSGVSDSQDMLDGEASDSAGAVPVLEGEENNQTGN